MSGPTVSKINKNCACRLRANIWNLTLFVALMLFAAHNTRAQDYKVKTIVVDAGHGGKDGSTRGLLYREKDVALQVALKLGAELQRTLPGVRIIYTRDQDVFVPLYERIAIANRANADLFISIHCNDMPATSYTLPGTGQRVYRKPTGTRGTETFVSGTGRMREQDEVLKRENAAMFMEENFKENYKDLESGHPENDLILSLMKGQNRTLSLRLAKYIQEEYVGAGRVNRGVQEKSLAVLARAGMPAVLTEIGFLSNPEEEEYIGSEAGQAEIVHNLVNAVSRYKLDRENNRIDTTTPVDTTNIKMHRNLNAMGVN